MLLIKKALTKQLVKALTASMLAFCFSTIASPLSVDISYLTLIQKQGPALSNYFKTPENNGYMGAKLAVNDSNTTGKFLQQTFNVSYFSTEKNEQLLAQLESNFQQGQRLFILDAPMSALSKVNDWAKNKAVLLFNIGESADEMRSKQCLANVFHTLPSNAMKSDALAQWLLHRRMNKVLLIKGSKDEDLQLTNAFKRSAKRYGLKIIEEKQWHFDTDLRRSAQQEIPLFTQTNHNYDVVYVADKSKDFAEFIPFNTYLPRPVIGSAGLEALAWHGVIEQWGAAQLQNRFRALANREMSEVDFAGYLALRSIAQSVHKLHSNDSAKIMAYLKSDAFELAAYKGRKLTYRAWNQQLRMPMALVQPHALVSQSPQQGILHPKTDLDTLGYDEKESQCRLSM